MAHYLDTSALVKLVVAESETSALTAWLEGRDGEIVSSDLARTELFRVVHRAAPERSERAREVLDAITLIELRTATFEQGGRLAPTALRSLDALHLAAALRLEDDLDSVVTYDERQADAARLNGIAITAPA
ncbi:MAG: type II toxin-antitoxin system VapC family toxin [Actinomycetota bacterium]|nr:type II toxin-antitoxin system VapC family toxin [Actinomycetota bacterium]